MKSSASRISKSRAAKKRKKTAKLKPTSGPAPTAGAGQPYVEVDGDPVWPGPYLHEGTTMYSFLVECEKAKLQELVERQLPGANLRPLVPYAIFQLACARKATSLSVPVGHLKTHDVAVSLLLTGPGKLLRLHAPYVFADNSSAVGVGREVLGFAKQFAMMSCSPPYDELEARLLDRLEVDAFVVPSAAQPEAAMKRVLEVQRVGSGQLPAWATLPGDFDWPAELAPLAALPALPSLDVKSISLKQFRHHNQPGIACHQELVEGALGIKFPIRVRVLSPAVGYQLKVFDHLSLHVAERLGLPAGQPIVPKLAIQTVFDMRVD